MGLGTTTEGEPAEGGVEVNGSEMEVGTEVGMEVGMEVKWKFKWKWE